MNRSIHLYLQFNENVVDEADRVTEFEAGFGQYHNVIHIPRKKIPSL
jgi:hypothetical protein